MNTQHALNTFVEETGGWVASQLEACTRCGICAEACHFYEATGNPEFAPVWKVELLKRTYEQRFTMGGKAKLAMGIDKKITDDDIWHWSKIVYEACTMCNKCAMVCPMGIQLGPIIHEVRTAMSNAGAVPEDLMAAVNKQVQEREPARRHTGGVGAAYRVDRRRMGSGASKGCRKARIRLWYSRRSKS